MLRVRFKTDATDPRPVVWPIKHPYWVTGYGEGYANIVAYADDEDEIKRNWPEAFDIDVMEETDKYVFTSRFRVPEWFSVSEKEVHTCNNSECGETTEADAREAAQPPNWTNSKMNPWMPDDNPKQARRLGKTGEEVNELGSVLFRISIQGIDSIDPSSGKTNRQRLLEETADVMAQCQCNMADLFTNDERKFVLDRSLEKCRQMAQWEAHYVEHTTGDLTPAQVRWAAQWFGSDVDEDYIARAFAAMPSKDAT